MHAILRRLMRDEAAATAVEYGLIAALVSVSAIGGIMAFGGSVTDVFSFLSVTVDAATQP